MNLKLFDYGMEPVIYMYIGEFIVKSLQAWIKKADYYNFSYVRNFWHFETIFKEKPAMENSKTTVGAKKASGLRLSHLFEFFQNHNLVLKKYQG